MTIESRKSNKWACGELYFGAASLRGDIQSMAALSDVYGPDSDLTDHNKQVYWCQQAYKSWKRKRGPNYEIDAINNFCPIETIAGLMSPSERAANNISVERAEATINENKAQAVATIRSIIGGAIADGMTQQYEYCSNGKKAPVSIGCENMAP